MRLASRQTPAWLFLLAAFLLEGSSIAASSAPIVPGEVIIRFAPSSEGHRIVVQLSGQPAPDLGDLAPVMSQLSTATGVPLVAKQLLSGQRLLLGIESDRIVEKTLLDVDLTAQTHMTAQRLSALSEIADAQPNYRSSIRAPEP